MSNPDLLESSADRSHESNSDFTSRSARDQYHTSNSPLSRTSSKRGKAGRKQRARKHSPHIALLPPETGIHEVLTRIVLELGFTDVDVAKWSQILKDNLIVNLGLLCRLSQSRIERLELPLLLEQELSLVIDWSTKQRDKLAILATHSGDLDATKQIVSGPDTERSSILGITLQERQLIRRSWERVCSDSNTESTLFETFYTRFMDNNAVARKLFEHTTIKKQASILKKIIRKIMESLERPAQVASTLSRLGARHLIYGVSPDDFQAFAVSFTHAMQVVLGVDVMNPPLKEAWYSLIINMGKIMTSGYDEIRAGVIGEIFRKAGGKWQPAWYKMSHTTLFICKTRACIKVRDEVALQRIENVDFTDDKEAPHEHCFSFDVRDIRYYFCFSSKTEQRSFAMQLNERILAHNRTYNSAEDSGSGSIKSTDSVANSLAHRLKSLAKITKSNSKKNPRTPPTKARANTVMN